MVEEEVVAAEVVPSAHGVCPQLLEVKISVPGAWPCLLSLVLVLAVVLASAW